VGFNPFRAHVARRGDVVIVVLAFAVIVALLAWAVFG
jgi:hypothetical protein